MISKKELLAELINKQRKNTPHSVLFGFKDLNRIVNNIDKSIFDNECTIWKGFIHSYKNNYYINFFYKGSKKNLSRLLYYNFVGKIEESEYIKTTCENGGKCCNIKHYQKFKKDLFNENVDNTNDQNDIINDIIKDNKLEYNKLEYNKLEDNKLEDNKLEDNKLKDNKLKDNKLKDNKLEDNKLEDNKLEDNKLEDNKLDNNSDCFKVIF